MSKHRLLTSIAVLAVVILAVFIALRDSAPSDIAAERQLLAELIRNVGAEEAYRELKADYADRHFSVQHLAAHLFGELLYDARGVGGITVCDGTMAFGCYHSFFGKAVAGEGMEILEELDRACIEKFTPWGLGCQHGIGHGLVEFLGHGEENLEKALAECATLDWQGLYLGCQGGVFMEYNFPTETDAASATTKTRGLSGDPRSPCPEVPKRFRPSCYYEQAQWWEKIFRGDFTKLGELCGILQDQKEREGCFRGIGNVAAAGTSYNVSRATALCDPMPTKEGRTLCLAGAAWGFFADPAALDRAPELCANLGTAERDICVGKSDLLKEQWQ